MEGENVRNWRHEWRAEHVQLILQNKRKLWFRLLEFCMLVHDFDPYAIFKCNLLLPSTSFNLSSINKIRECSHVEQSQEQKIIDTRHDRSLYRSKELQLSHTRRDKFRQRATGPLKLFAVYFVIKSLIISLAHHTLMRYEYLVPRKNLSSSRPLMSIESAQLIVRHLGIPFYALKDISLTLFFTATCFCNICIVVLPMFQRRHPVNMASLRFVLNPHLELRRVDASIRRKLTATKCSLQVYQQQQANQYGRAAETLHKREFITSGQDQIVWLDELRRREHDYCRHIEACLDQLSSTDSESLRPSTFEPQYFVSISNLLGHVVLNTHANYSFVWLVVTSSLVLTEYSVKCPQFDCNPAGVFTWPEILVAVEAQTIFAIACLSCCLNFSLLALLTASQLKIIKSIGLELSACQRAMSSCILVERRARVHAIDDCNRQIETKRDELEKFLLHSIVRLSICDRELKDNARAITEQTIHPACYMGSALFLAALNIQFKLPESNFLRSFVVGVIWLSVNMIAVSCANIHARVLGLQRSLWSILALGSQLRENNYYARQVDLRSTKYTVDIIGSGDFHPSQRWWSRRETRATTRLKGKCCTFVADLWLKFVYSTSANIEQHCSRLLRMELSYQNIIEANFFSIFIYSLTLAYDR